MEPTNHSEKTHNQHIKHQNEIIGNVWEQHTKLKIAINDSTIEEV
jgi:hypothetical protein